MRKKVIALLLVLFIILPVADVLGAENDGGSLQKTENTQSLVIVLDPGHDSTHAGAGGNGLREEKQVLKIGQYLREELNKYKNVTVYMTRDAEGCPFPETCGVSEGSKRCNEARVAFAKSVGADIYIALHLNAAGNTGAKGALAFVPNNNYSSEAGAIGQGLGRTIVNKLAELGLENDGIVIKESASDTKPEEFYYPDGSIADYYRVIRYAKKELIPAIIVEHGFISNASDAANYLTTDEQLKALAIKDAQGIVEYYGLSLKDGQEESPNPPVTVTPSPAPQPMPQPTPEPEPETESTPATEIESETKENTETQTESDTNTQIETESSMMEETEEINPSEETQVADDVKNGKTSFPWKSVVAILILSVLAVGGILMFRWYRKK